jgi:hypothetical protein
VKVKIIPSLLHYLAGKKQNTFKIDIIDSSLESPLSDQAESSYGLIA